MLVLTVVVDEHGGRTDVAVLADVRIANVGQVRNLGSVADGRVLDLHIRPGLGTCSQVGARSQVGERSDAGVVADHREFGPGMDHFAVRPDLTGHQRGSRADAGSRGDGGRAPQDGLWQQLRIRFDFHIHIDPGARGIGDAHAGAHPALVDSIAHDRRRLGQLHPVVYAADVIGVGRNVSVHHKPVCGDHAHDVGEVLLALSVVGVQARDALDEG